jgi:SAM-dependent methyltransferase
VLELACGTGRVSWPLAAAGHDVTGLDLNEPMLRIAEAKGRDQAAETRDRIRFVRGDMGAFNLDREFALVFSTFRSFQSLLTVEEQRACLGCARRHLRPGGRLVLNLFDPLLHLCTPEPRGPRLAERCLNPVTGLPVEVEVISRDNDPHAQILEEVWLFTERETGGQVRREERELLRMRWSYRYEMQHLLELCGFEVVAEYSGFDGEPPAYGKEQVWVAVRA